MKAQKVLQIITLALICLLSVIKTVPLKDQKESTKPDCYFAITKNTLDNKLEPLRNTVLIEMNKHIAKENELKYADALFKLNDQYETEKKQIEKAKTKTKSTDLIRLKSAYLKKVDSAIKIHDKRFKPFLDTDEKLSNSESHSNPSLINTTTKYNNTKKLIEDECNNLLEKVKKLRDLNVITSSVYTAREKLIEDSYNSSLVTLDKENRNEEMLNNLSSEERNQLSKVYTREKYILAETLAGLFAVLKSKYGDNEEKHVEEIDKCSKVYAQHIEKLQERYMNNSKLYSRKKIYSFGARQNSSQTIDERFIY